MPILIEFENEDLNDNWYDYFDIYMVHMDNDSEDWNPTFYELEICETDDVPNDFDDFEIDSFAGYYCLPADMSHKIYNKSSSELSLYISHCDPTQAGCTDILTDETN